MKQYRPRLTRCELAIILTDMDDRDIGYNKNSKLFVVREELKARLDELFRRKKE